MFSLGVRAGELLGLKTNDLNRAGSFLSITRSADDPEDIRMSQPQAKTSPRDLPLAPHLSLKLLDFIRKDRASIPAKNRRHSFIFISKDGRPLAQQTLGQIFRDLRKCCPKLPVDLTAHKLRYSCTDGIWEMIDQKGGEENQKVDQLRAMMGWSSNSKMPFKYGRRYLTRKANIASIAHQNQFFKKANALENS